MVITLQAINGCGGVIRTQIRIRLTRRVKPVRRKSFAIPGFQVGPTKMEKRKKNITADDFLSVSDDQLVSEPSENVSMKTKHQLTPLSMVLSFSIIISLYLMYILMLGPNNNLPSITIHIPSFREDINLHIPSMRNDSLPVLSINELVKIKGNVEDNTIKTVATGMNYVSYCFEHLIILIKM